MTDPIDTPFFGAQGHEVILELLVDETAGSLSLLSDFELGLASGDDEVVHDRPGADESVRVAFRFGFRTKHGARMGFVQIPLSGALTLAGSLLMLPTDALRAEAEREAPDEGHKEAIMEAGFLLGGAFDSAVRKRCDADAVVKFFGCQGVGPGEAPWVSGYKGEPMAVRRQLASFGALDPFEILIAVPA